MIGNIKILQFSLPTHTKWLRFAGFCTCSSDFVTKFSSKNQYKFIVNWKIVIQTDTLNILKMFLQLQNVQQHGYHKIGTTISIYWGFQRWEVIYWKKFRFLVQKNMSARCFIYVCHNGIQSGKFIPRDTKNIFATKLP